MSQPRPGAGGGGSRWSSSPRSAIQSPWEGSAEPLEGDFPLIVSLDLEATGLSSAVDHVIEIGAVKFRGTEVIERYHTLVNPGVRLPGMIRRLTGISDADLASAPRLAAIVPGLRAFVGGADVLAHGAGYDISFLREALGADLDARDVFDSIDVARVLLPAASSYSLGSLCDHFAIQHPRPHHALEDAEATFRLFIEMVREARRLDEAMLRRLRELTAGSTHSIRSFFHDLVPGPPERAMIPAQLVAAGVELPPRAALAHRPAEAVAAMLGPLGPLATEPGWEPREPQAQMCLAVAQAFERGRNLVVEAGTGTGKSLAYLLPALSWAASRGEQVCVSTHTINLQEQLLHKDLPLAARILGVPLRAVLLKGRAHYIGRLRWEHLQAGTSLDSAGVAPEIEGIDPRELLLFKLKVTVWLARTATGDRDELRMFGQDERIWRSVASDWSDCRSPDCVNGPTQCFYHRSRKRAADADVVVVNHALLLADAFRDSNSLPAATRLVVDEAHHIEEAATKGLTEELREDDLLALMAMAGTGGNRASLSLVRAKEATRATFDSLRDLCRSLTGSDSGRDLRLDGQLLQARMYDATRELLASLESARRGLLPGEAALLEPRLERLLSILTTATPDCVGWVSFARDGRGTVRSAPIDVATPLRAAIFDGRETVVMTSATLALNGSFEYLRRRTGMPGSGLDELVLKSPFDFLNQALLCLPDDLPAPGEEGFETALVEAVSATARELGGRTLVLFTSADQLERVAGELRLRLEPEGIDVLAQARSAGGRRALAQQFAAHPEAVLCGTSSFWEGVDLPGTSLACVFIVRLPFRPPDSPVHRARGNLLADAFLELALPEAVLRLKQGFGRLIRRAGDRGAVVILDSRVSTRGYGAHFVEALPECSAFTGSAADLPGAVRGWVEGRALSS